MPCLLGHENERGQLLCQGYRPLRRRGSPPTLRPDRKLRKSWWVAGKYLASTTCDPINPNPPKWPYLPRHAPSYGIFRTLINLDILCRHPLGKGEVESSIPSGSTSV
jgi:hypothetical protein